MKWKLFDKFRWNRSDRQIHSQENKFHRKYNAFKGILEANNRALEIIAELEQTVYLDKPFTLWFLSERSAELIRKMNSIVEDLNLLTEVKYPQLFPASEKIVHEILALLAPKPKPAPTALTMPLEQLSLENRDEVGGKAANLGEVYNRVHLPVPPGFAVTTYACQKFLDHNRLPEFIESRLRSLEIEDTEILDRECREIQSRVLNAEMPPDLENALRKAATEMKLKIDGGLRLSVRSSAASEDSEASFAGQHSTVLNVGENRLAGAYKEVVASMFNPRAVFYRRSRGYRDQDVIMSIACIAMVEAAIGGVMYTVDPNDSRHAVLMISAVYGLPVGAVDGTAATDFYQINKCSGIVERSEIAIKKNRLQSDDIDGLVQVSVSDEQAERSCLNPSQIERLRQAALRLEGHYGCALDIEWAIDGRDQLYILQTRPLKRSAKISTVPAGMQQTKALPQIDAEILLQGGAPACEGTASGIAFVLRSDHNFHHIPKGAVVVARQTSPRYVPLMGRIRAMVTDVGSVTGHMASVAREFHIPTLVGTADATDKIPHGAEITVDAVHGVVYRGRVDCLLKENNIVNPMKGSPVYQTARSLLRHIAPLNLTDPREDHFQPESCHTVHDVIRFCHEMAMQTMFRIGEDIPSRQNIAVPLRAYLPLRIYVIDLGGGLSIASRDGSAGLEHVTSLPFQALLRGMTHEKVDWSHSVGVSWKGFASIVAESVFRDPLKEGRMGGPNYAIVSGNYLNFNSRLGYHFAVVDTYCGPEVNDNYITFSFKGGAADIGRRSRRALMIARILKNMGFKVEQTGDMVRGELKKYECRYLEEKLDRIGRLTGSVQLLDMVLADDKQIDWYVEQFLRGNYTFASDDTARPPDIG
ncbi:MAG TPA: PEP/pyruvate-binding domain-containing protein [Desulfobacterales bacterium]